MGIHTGFVILEEARTDATAEHVEVHYPTDVRIYPVF